MDVEIRPLHPLFVAEISGMDLGQPLDGGAVRALWEAIDRYAVLVFHDQRLSDEQLRDFAGKFGKLEIGRSAAEGGKRRLALPEIGDISNLDEEGRLRERNDRRRLDSLGNRIWHTDASYMPVPVVLGMLHAVAVPLVLGMLHAVAVPLVSALGGGQTEFADMRAAHDALPQAMQDAIDGLVAEHDVFWSRGQIGFTNFLPGEREKYPPSQQRLVRRHPGSKRKTLYLSAHASHNVGWPVPEGRILLYDLNLHATRPEFVYSHDWRVGDLVIWDNRCTMHRGRPHDDTHPRDLHRATTLDVRSTLDEVA